MFEKFHSEEHPDKFANLDPDFGADNPLHRWDTSLEYWGHAMGNKWGPLLGEKIGNMFENLDPPRAEKNEYSDTSTKLPKIFSWTATGSFSWARSLGKSLLDFFR